MKTDRGHAQKMTDLIANTINRVLPQCDSGVSLRSMKHQAIQRELDSFLPGESGVITSVAKGELAAKMAEMGIFLGKKVRVLYKAPFGGPIAVDLEGYTLSLRLEEAHLVAVVPAN